MTEAAPNSRCGISLWAQILVWAILLSLLVLVGFGVKQAGQGSVQPGDKISSFSLQLFNGYEYDGQGRVKLSDLSGRVVFINFWASWCKPCEQEASVLEEAWKIYQPGGRVVFLGVDYLDTEYDARIFLRKFGSTYPNGPDVGTVVSQLFHIKGVPETYIIDTKGVLRHVKVGPFVALDEIKTILDPLLR
jgi:cytochrome c biogenesis protein CcmG, thiol:disulfide interchange protein DsbE